MIAPSWRRLFYILIWTLVVLAGTGAFAVVAFARAEPVNALWLVVTSGCVFAVAYRFHSAWLMAKVLTLDDLRATPALSNEDGKDFVPTNKWVVFGHHFAAIAGPGPLVGPVLAAQFGYLPGLLWILVGATLGGAVHDCLILFCSVRRRAKSLGQMIREEVGSFAGVVSLIAILAIMVILLAVLALVVVKALAESPWGLSTILISMPVAVVMGLAMRFTKLGIGLISVLGVAALIAGVVAGSWLHGSALEGLLAWHGTTLAWAIMGYGLLASALPVWMLLAPRDYLSSYLKIGVVGILAAAIIAIAPRLEMPALTKFIDGTGPVFAGAVFPFVFITIACAAVSGFHALIASGTTPKLIARERDIRVIGYGAMITEMLVGVMALIAACSLQPGQYFAINMKGAPAQVTQAATALGFPVTESEMSQLAAQMGEKNLVGRTGGATTFAVGMAHIFSKVFGNRISMSLWYHFAIMFEAMFILTTIDAGTRVGRFLLQDLLGMIWTPLGRTDSVFANWGASALFVAAWGYFLYQGVVDPLGGINSLWPIFGVANQLLAVMALSLGLTVLLKMGRARYAWVAALPLTWLVIVTTSAGWLKIFSPDPRLGFLSAASGWAAKLEAGGTAAELQAWRTQLWNNYIDAGVTAMFLVFVFLVLGACARVWWQILVGRKVIPLAEDTYRDRAAFSGGDAMAG